MVNVVLLGAPGAGKGTQAEQIMRRYGIPQISTGEIFRRNIREGTPLGTAAKAYLDAGGLVPDELTVNLVKDRLAEPDCAKGFILDGFPRNIPQAEALDSLLTSLGQKLGAVVSISITDAEIVGRLSGRRVCRGCGKTYHIQYNPSAVEGLCDNCGGEVVQRDDDREATVLQRLAVYHAQTAPLLDFYRKAGVLLEITSHEKVEDTSAEMVSALAKVFGQGESDGPSGSGA
ncbi:MAG: adenylate kinase [Clostridiales bacterium]|nr:adenylate kinase [Clostridiales bacterium]